MPDPIASGSSRKLSSSYDDAVCREEPQTPAVAKTSTKATASADPKPEAASHEDVVAKLPTREVDYSKLAATAPKREASETKEEKKLPTNSNQERTTAREGISPYAAMGKTSSGDAFAGAAALKGRDPKSGLELEMASVSLQRGWQNEAQVGVARIGGSSADGARSGTAEFGTVRVAGGIHNPDGSTGLNFAATAVLLGAEATHEVGKQGSVTGGANFGVGGEASIGVKTAEDGKPELCFRVGVDPGVLAFCLKKPW